MPIGRGLFGPVADLGGRALVAAGERVIGPDRTFRLRLVLQPLAIGIHLSEDLGVRHAPVRQLWVQAARQAIHYGRSIRCPGAAILAAVVLVEDSPPASCHRESDYSLPVALVRDSPSRSVPRCHHVAAWKTRVGLPADNSVRQARPLTPELSGRAKAARGSPAPRWVLPAGCLTPGRPLTAEVDCRRHSIAHARGAVAAR